MAPRLIATALGLVWLASAAAQSNESQRVEAIGVERYCRSSGGSALPNCAAVLTSTGERDASAGFAVYIHDDCPKAPDPAQAPCIEDWLRGVPSEVEHEVRGWIAVVAEKRRRKLQAEAEERAEYEAFQQRRAQTEKTCQRRGMIPGNVRLGMTADQVRRCGWGDPASINRTTTRRGTSEQWVYGSNRYLYFANGVLETIQD